MKQTPQTVLRKLAALFTRMEESYDAHAGALGLTCADCPKNCCVSYFKHHTYLEWTFLHKGLKGLSPELQAEVRARAEDNVRQSMALISQGMRPRILCPLNVDGLCILYSHRLMICRMHGVPNRLVKPNGQAVDFPGCWRMQELANELGSPPPLLDRTPLYRDLAALEMNFLGKAMRSMPRVDMTIAEMIVAGPPTPGRGR